MTKNLSAKYNRILQTGEWWYDSWWKESQYQGKFSEKQTEDAFNTLISIFDAKWMMERQKDNQNPHPLMNLFFYEGPLILDELIELGTDLYITIKTKNIIGNRRSRIKNPKDCLGAWLELKILSHLLQERCSIIPNWPPGKKNGRNCDFKVEKNSDVVFLEVKHLDVSEQAELIIGQSIINARCQNTGETVLGLHCDQGYQIPQQHEVNRILSVIKDKQDQLPEEGPGCIVISVPISFGDYRGLEEQAESLFNEDDTFLHISGILTVYFYMDIQRGSCYQPFFIKNPKAKTDISSYSFMKGLLPMPDPH